MPVFYTEIFEIKLSSMPLCWENEVHSLITYLVFVELRELLLKCSLEVK